MVTNGLIHSFSKEIKLKEDQTLMTSALIHLLAWTQVQKKKLMSIQDTGSLSHNSINREDNRDHPSHAGRLHQREEEDSREELHSKTGKPSHNTDKVATSNSLDQGH